MSDELSQHEEVTFFCSNRRCGTLLSVEFGYPDKYYECDKCGTDVRVPKSARKRVVQPTSKKAGKKSAAAPAPQPVIEYATGPTLWEHLSAWGSAEVDVPHSHRLPSFLTRVPIGLWYFLGALTTMGAWIGIAAPDLPSNHDEVIEEISAVQEIYNAPVPNHDGSRIAFMRSSEDGLSLLIADFDRGQTNLVEEFPGTRLIYESTLYYKLLGWNTDSTRFAYTKRKHVDYRDREAILVIADGRTGEILHQKDLPDHLEGFVWLNHSRMTFLSAMSVLSTASVKAGQITVENTLRLDFDDRAGVERSHNGRRKLSATPFVRFDEQSIAYVKGGQFHTIDPLTAEQKQISHFSTNRIAVEWLSYQPDNRRFLFCDRLSAKRYQRRAFTHTLTSPTNGNLAMLALQPGNIVKATPLNNGHGHLALINRGPIDFLALSRSANTAATNAFTEGTVRAFTVSGDGQQIFVVGAQQHEPHAIWRLSLHGRAEKVIPTAPETFYHTSLQPPIKSYITDKNGQRLNFYLLQPVNMDRSKRYPLIIDTPNQGRWNHYSQLVANLGAYYMAVNRDGLMSSDRLGGAAEDMLAVYEHLKTKANVDLDRVYAMGTSASTRVISELVNQNPDILAGAIFNNAVSVPQVPFANGHRPRMLVSMGDAEANLLPMVDRFILAAEDNYIPVIHRYHENAGHILRGQRLLKNRMSMIGRFVAR